MKVLAACGCDASFPHEQHCCGLVALNVGDRVHGRKMAEQTIEMLENVDADWIVTNTTSCLAAMTDDYRNLFRDDPAWLERVERQSERLIEFTKFLIDVAQLEGEDFVSNRRQQISSVTYHDACQSHNALGLGSTARTLITDVLGIELREMADASVCCGFGAPSRLTIRRYHRPSSRRSLITPSRPAHMPLLPTIPAACSRSAAGSAPAKARLACCI